MCVCVCACVCVCSGIGGGIDSFFEYLYKAYLLTGKKKYLKKFNQGAPPPPLTPAPLQPTPPRHLPPPFPLHHGPARRVPHPLPLAGYRAIMQHTRHRHGVWHVDVDMASGRRLLCSCSPTAL